MLHQDAIAKHQKVSCKCNYINYLEPFSDLTNVYIPELARKRFPFVYSLRVFGKFDQRFFLVLSVFENEDFKKLVYC